MNGNDLPVYSNTCWWADPEKGKGIALPLFLMVLKKSQSHMFLTDCTEHTRTILEKTGIFKFDPPRHGIRGFLRFYFAAIICRKYPKSASLRFVAGLVDVVLNLFLWPIRISYLKKFEQSSLSYKPVDKIDSETELFIRSHSSDEFVARTAASFNWQKEYPWVKTGDKKSNDYPFSYVVDNYSLVYLKLMIAGKMVGFLAFSLRDNLLKIPYLYFDETYRKPVMNFILWYALKMNCNSIVSFHPEVIRFWTEHRLPFLFRKDEWRHAGVSSSLSEAFTEKTFLQDGDGDFIFT